MRTELLVLQPTPGCNIDCAYCYLPGREARSVMPVATMRAAVKALRAERLVGRRLTVAWHAGEPLMLAPSYYEAAFAAMADAAGSRLRLTHRFQTNAIAVTDAHCVLLAREGAQVGVSLDGPADLHDARRQTRTRQGTHALTVRGLQRLQAHGLGPDVICAVTADSLPHGARLIEYFGSLGIDRVALNFEETEGGHTSSLAQVPLAAVRTFLQDVQRAAAATGVRVREFVLQEQLDAGAAASRALVTPLAVVAVDWQGGFSTFSPELLSASDPRYGPFVLGNVHGGGLRQALETDRFALMHRDVAAGVSRCRRSCRHFFRCGGGAPSNKLAETGTFDVAETMSCRIRHQAVHAVHARRDPTP